MGTAACSQTLKAVGCSQLAIVLRGMNREERQAMDEESDHSVDTFREHMRRQAGLPDLDDLRAEEAEEKRRVVLERSRPSKQQRPKGDPLQLARPGSTLASRVAAAVSTGLERQDADFAVKTCHVAGTPSLETLADDFGASIRSERGRLPEWQRPNQDEALFVLLRDGYRIGVVVDGHGPDGHSVAHVVRDFLFRRLASSLPSKRSDSLDDYRIGMYQLLAETLQDADQLLFSGQEAADARASGATTCVTIHDQKKRWIFSAWETADASLVSLWRRVQHWRFRAVAATPWSRKVLPLQAPKAVVGRIPSPSPAAG
ncbi:unnamed protein product [Effrenium voratum]|uniref:PPM-type phosphatase domain-containing protein n=1 Tax=Effrenium voratum TaxID=2562239 RepID=A0AA36JRV1_9DINO|nr:unnamed protein product [Effrenium voratum]